MARLQDLIVRPGIEKRLVPLLLYRGQQTLGRVHQLWNQAIVSMEANAASISQVIKTQHNEDIAQLCGPHKLVQHISYQGFFSRLRLNPDVTNNIPGLTEFVADVCPRPFQLIPVPLRGYRVKAPWREELARPRKQRVINPERPVKSADLFYPYVVFEPKAENNLLFAINAAVPKNLPEQIRADLCQDLAVAVLCGEVAESDLQGEVPLYLKKAMKLFPTKYGPLSLDAPAPWAESGDMRTVGQMIDSNAAHW